VLPAVTGGTVVAGQTLSTTTGNWTSHPTGYRYGWELCDSSGGSCVTLSDQSAPTYALTSDEAGDTIRSVVQATNRIGSGSAVSPPTPPVAAPSWDGSFSTGDWTQYSDCRADNVDGDWPTDYAIDSVTAGLGPSTCEGQAPKLVHAVPPPAGFTYAGAFTVRGNDESDEREAGERALDRLDPDNGDGSAGPTVAYQGASTWYRDDVYVPAGFQPTPKSDFNWMFLIHNYPDDEGDDMLSCGLDTDPYAPGPFSDGGGHGVNPSPERFSCRIFGGGNEQYPFDDYDSTDWYRNPAVSWHYIIGLRTVQTGVWYDMVWHVVWDWRSAASGGNGSMTWWIDGKRVATYAGPTLLYLSNAPGSGGGGGADQGYLQTGYYRPTNAEASFAQQTDTVYHAATMIGPTCTSIGEPALC
jgi:Polysaccharide lyase